MGSDLRRHRTAAQPRHSRGTPQTPPRLSGLVDSRSSLHPLPRITRQLADQHRQRLLRRLPVPAVHVAVSRPTPATVAWLADARRSGFAGAADVHPVADVHLGRKVFSRMGDCRKLSPSLTFRDGADACPDCGTLKDKRAKRCRSCSFVARRRPLNYCACGKIIRRDSRRCYACARINRGLPVRERFMAKVEVAPSGCWEWQGWRAHGYGYFWHEGRERRAHRVSYELFIGPIPDGLQIDHLCRNCCCVNPAHLEAVTGSENQRRAHAARRAAEDRDRVMA